MKCTILHESRGRMRVHVNAVRMTLHRADVLEAYLNHSEAIEHAKVYERTGDVLIQYKGSRAGAVTVLSHYKFDNPELDSLVTSADSRKINQEYQERFVNLVVFRAFRKLFLPAPVQAVITVFKAIEFIRRGLVCLWHRKLEVEVLDALSIGVSLLRSDFNTAGSVMFLLNVGALLEEWTRKKSLDDLARSMSLNVDRVWVRSQGTEVLMPITKVKAGDEIIVRSGNMVPLDGTVIEGEAMVNQAALTGESMPVRKIAGATVYAGTVVEEGECVFAANAVDGASRYDKIVSMIEESEKLKSGTENHALELADRLVPWCLAGTVVTYALTRNVTRAISILMVDFSCALKLSMPLAVLSAMRECGSYHITVKGGKYLEALSKADTIVFDKTGTLTHASPKVVKVVPFSGCDEEEVLKLAACLEEHFPHSMANAVVRAAKERGITQKQAAEDLGVSQALLSHYEKGIRECGLDFVVRVADYYNVSCDYLLGRSAERNGMMLSAEDLPNPEKMKDNVYHGSVLPTMNKKLISNSLNVLYAKIGQCHSKALTTEVSAYLMMAVAKMFRMLYSAEPHNASSMFSIEPHRWHGYSDAVMRMAEANVEALLDGQDVNGGEGVKDPACLAMTTESLTREFPLYTPSLLNLVKTSETHVKGLSPQE